MFVLTGGDEDKVVLQSAEVAFTKYQHTTLLYLCISYYSKTVVEESRMSPNFQILGRHGNIKSMIKCMYWALSQVKHLKHWPATVGKL